VISCGLRLETLSSFYHHRPGGGLEASPNSQVTITVKHLPEILFLFSLYCDTFFYIHYYCLNRKRSVVNRRLENGRRQDQEQETRGSTINGNHGKWAAMHLGSRMLNSRPRPTHPLHPFPLPFQELYSCKTRKLANIELCGSFGRKFLSQRSPFQPTNLSLFLSFPFL